MRQAPRRAGIGACSGPSRAGGDAGPDPASPLTAPRRRNLLDDAASIRQRRPTRSDPFNRDGRPSALQLARAARSSRMQRGGRRPFADRPLYSCQDIAQLDWEVRRNGRPSEDAASPSRRYWCTRADGKLRAQTDTPDDSSIFTLKISVSVIPLIGDPPRPNILSKRRCGRILTQRQIIRVTSACTRTPGERRRPVPAIVPVAVPTAPPMSAPTRPPVALPFVAPATSPDTAPDTGFEYRGALIGSQTPR